VFIFLTGRGNFDIMEKGGVWFRGQCTLGDTTFLNPRISPRKNSSTTFLNPRISPRKKIRSQPRRTYMAIQRGVQKVVPKKIHTKIFNTTGFPIGDASGGLPVTLRVTVSGAVLVAVSGTAARGVPIHTVGIQ